MYIKHEYTCIYIRKKSPRSSQKSPIFPQKSSVSLQKSPVSLQKRPLFRKRSIKQESYFTRGRTLYFRERGILKKSHVSPQKIPKFPQKSHIFPQKYLYMRQRAFHFCTKALYLYQRARDHRQKACISCKRAPYLRQKALYIHKRDLCLRKRSPHFPRKRPRSCLENRPQCSLPLSYTCVYRTRALHLRKTGLYLPQFFIFADFFRALKTSSKKPQSCLVLSCVDVHDNSLSSVDDVVCTCTWQLPSVVAYIYITYSRPLLCVDVHDNSLSFVDVVVCTCTRCHR